MKNTLITFLLILLCRQGDAQYKPLQIGEKMPDFEFQIKNYRTPTAKISDFKGKLVLLDFWSTYCSSCIAGFPKMEKLQKEFGDKIIVILVNIRETEKELNSRLNARKKTISELSRMPSIIGEEVFAELFPHRYAGNYVWIDPQGILRLNSGVSHNIHSKKIQEVLDGKKISFLTTGDYYGLSDKTPTLLDIVHDTDPVESLYSIFTPVNLTYYPVGGQKLNEYDPVSNTVRNTYINRTLIQLYFNTLQPKFTDGWNLKVFGPNLEGFDYLDFFKLMVRDTSLYERSLITQKNRTDENMANSLICYEQLLPKSTSKEYALDYMQRDLDNYIKIKHKGNVAVEEVEIPCYYIRTVQNYEQKTDTEIKKQLNYLGKRIYSNNFGYKSTLNAYFRTVENFPYVFAEENSNQKNKIVMPEWDKSDPLEDFQAALKLNGYELIKGRKKVKMIVIRD